MYRSVTSCESVLSYCGYSGVDIVTGIRCIKSYSYRVQTCYIAKRAVRYFDYLISVTIFEYFKRNGNFGYSVFVTVSHYLCSSIYVDCTVVVGDCNIIQGLVLNTVLIISGCVTNEVEVFVCKYREVRCNRCTLSRFGR